MRNHCQAGCIGYQAVLTALGFSKARIGNDLMGTLA